MCSTSSMRALSIAGLLSSYKALKIDARCFRPFFASVTDVERNLAFTGSSLTAAKGLAAAGGNGAGGVEVAAVFDFALSASAYPHRAARATRAAVAIPIDVSST